MQLLLMKKLLLLYRLFLGPNHKILKTTKFDDETNENHVKCKVEEVNKLLSLRKVILGQPRYEKKYAFCFIIVSIYFHY